MPAFTLNNLDVHLFRYQSHRHCRVHIAEDNHPVWLLMLQDRLDPFHYFRCLVGVSTGTDTY